MHRRGATERGLDRGQSETIGVVLLLAITVIGTTAIVALGASALTDSRDSSRSSGVEHSMTQLDSRMAMVALGDSDSQNVDFSESGDGRYDVRPGAGWVNITHVNQSGSGDVETIINATLGAVVYESSETEITYQAGGVWRHQNNGSVMISPPEFHYQDSTLTFPLIRVDGDSSISGTPTANIEIKNRSNRLYPNASDTYDESGDTYLNPVEEGNITITLHSTYYQAWAEYFRDRTNGDVTEFHGNETVEVTLVTSRMLGDFDMPSEGNSVEIRGMEDGHPIDEFTLTLKPDPHFNNMHWSLYEKSGNRKFEIHIFSSDNCAGGYSDDLDVSVFYYNGTNGYHEWQNQSVNPNGPDFEVDCSDDTLTANLTGETALDFNDTSFGAGGSDQWHFGSEIDDNTVSDTVKFEQHDEDDDDSRNGIYNSSNGETEELGFLVNHYLSLMGSDTDLTITDGPGGSSRVDEGASTGTIDYGTAGNAGFLTFLHITENEVEVDIE